MPLWFVVVDDFAIDYSAFGVVLAREPLWFLMLMLQVFQQLVDR
jgi:hypothetical protein